MSQKKKLRLIALVIMSVSLALITCLIIGACFFTSLHKKDKTDAVSRYKLLIGIVDGKKESYNSYTDRTVRDGVRFTDFTRISDRLKWTTVRNGNDIRFYLNNEDEDTLSLKVGESIVYVNRNPVRIKGKSFELSGNLYLPLDFVGSAFDGITVTENAEKNTVTIEYLEPEKCSLRLKYPVPLEPSQE